MYDHDVRFQCMLSLAANLRLSADTIRMFADDDEETRFFTYRIAALSTRIEDDAKALETLAHDEIAARHKRP